MIASKFQYILDNYINEEKTVSNLTPLYFVLINELPNLLKQRFSLYENLLFKGSMGQGNKTEYPWLCIFNKKITTSAQRGLYLVYLFKKDMSGFYLSLNQGFTYFEELYRKDKYKEIKKVVDYYRTQILDTNFSNEQINLGNPKKGSLGYGYQTTNIISKYYPSNNFTTNELVEDLKKMVDIYNEIYRHMDVDSYKEIINRIVVSTNTGEENLVIADEAIETIKTALEPIDGQPYDYSKTIQVVEPRIHESTKYHALTDPKIRKIDYIKKAKKDAETGYFGEMKVMEFEKERLTQMGLPEYAEKVKHVSIKSDAYGYDILSYDLINGEIKEIYIEVKSSVNKVDCKFQVSRAEVEKSKEKGEQYFVYRIYDINNSPKMYRVQGEIEQHFHLDPETYLASYKG